MAMSPAEFIERLDALFMYKGVAYGRTRLISDEQEKHAQATRKFKGYVALSSASRCFFLYSIEGVEPGKPVDVDAVRKLRKATEQAIRRKMTGSQSGLPHKPFPTWPSGTHSSTMRPTVHDYR